MEGYNLENIFMDINNNYQGYFHFKVREIQVPREVRWLSKSNKKWQQNLDVSLGLWPQSPANR